MKTLEHNVSYTYKVRHETLRALEMVNESTDFVY